MLAPPLFIKKSQLHAMQLAIQLDPIALRHQITLALPFMLIILYIKSSHFAII